MSVQDTAELIQVKNQIFAIEKFIEDKMMEFSKKKKIDFLRTNDHGQRGFTIPIFFDDFNIEAFDHAEAMRQKYSEFTELKKRQRALEESYDTDVLLMNNMKREIRNV